MARFSSDETKFKLGSWNDRKQNLTTIPKVLATRALSGETVRITGGKIYADGGKVRVILEVAPCNE